MPWKDLFNKFFSKREDPLLPVSEKPTVKSQDAPDKEHSENEKSVAPDSQWALYPAIAERTHVPPEVIVPPPRASEPQQQGPVNYEEDLASSTVYRRLSVPTNPFGDQYAVPQTSTSAGPQQQLEIPAQPQLLQPAATTKNFSRPSYVPPGNKITWLPDPNTFARSDGLPPRPGSLTVRPGFRRQVSSISGLSIKHDYPEIINSGDPARKLSVRNLYTQRILFLAIVVAANLGCLMAALFSGNGMWVFVFILVIKSKDVLSSAYAPLGLLTRWIYRVFKPYKEVPPKWILSVIPAYSESEEQIVKCIFSLRDNAVEPHRQVMCVIMDGKPRDVKSHYTELFATIERPYISYRYRLGQLTIHAGFMEDVPVIVIEKKRNAGKKDSLILAHDLFNHPRKSVPLYTKLLRNELWQHVLPDLTSEYAFDGFDMIFCTDADSIIHKGALASLCNALARDENSIAACGLVLVELEPGRTWSVWNLYQQFQYCFGQYVRRRAEHFWGKVTCLPGCITMIKCRPECAGAIAKYAEPVTVMPVLHHQVQYLGTDRRLTYCLLSQSIKLKTLFVPGAVSETVAPQSLKHYLSQRRRWGSNAYFNNYFYVTGERMSPITRVAASIEILRLSMVYYRFANTVLLIHAIIIECMAGTFNISTLVPMLAVSQFPLMWFVVQIFFEKPLRRRAHKLFLGFCINKMVSPFVSMTVFFTVCRNVGSQVWGMSGVTAAGGSTTTTAAAAAAADGTTTSATASSLPAVTAAGLPAVPAVPVVPAAPLVPSVAIVPAIPGAPAVAAVAVPPPPAVMTPEK